MNAKSFAEILIALSDAKSLFRRQRKSQLLKIPWQNHSASINAPSITQNAPWAELIWRHATPNMLLVHLIAWTLRLRKRKLPKLNYNARCVRLVWLILFLISARRVVTFPLLRFQKSVLKSDLAAETLTFNLASADTLEFAERFILKSLEISSLPSLNARKSESAD